jgi:F1F0 ATPase subunit 2
MNNIPLSTIMVLTGAFIAGLALGIFYFTALWRTVRKLPDTLSPLKLVLGSFVLRLLVVLPGFYFIMDGHWERLAAALAGFVLVRAILVRRYGRVSLA